MSFCINITKFLFVGLSKIFSKNERFHFLEINARQVLTHFLYQGMLSKIPEKTPIFLTFLEQIASGINGLLFDFVTFNNINFEKIA